MKEEAFYNEGSCSTLYYLQADIIQCLQRALLKHANLTYFPKDHGHVSLVWTKRLKHYLPRS